MPTIKLLLGIFCLTVTSLLHHTHWNLLIPAPKLTQLAVLKEANERALLVGLAQQEIGVREKNGHNDGLRVEMYLATVDLKRGEPWCAAFICFLYAKAGFLKPRSGWSPDLFPAFRLARSALPGDVFGIYFSSKKRIAHVGLVEKITGNWCLGIEGNTNIAGGREGDGVFRKRRNLKTIYRFANWLKQKGRQP